MKKRYYDPKVMRKGRGYMRLTVWFGILYIVIKVQTSITKVLIYHIMNFWKFYSLIDKRNGGL